MTDEFKNKIDVHFHYLSPEYREQMIDAVGGWPDGFAAPNWSAEATLAMMDRMNIATGMLSVSSPGVHFGNDAKARLLARSVNEFAARTIGEHRGRFGGFASLPLPDVDGALREIRIRARHAQARRHRDAHQLQRRVSRRQAARSGLR